MADKSKYQWDTSGGVVKYGGKAGGVTLDTALLDKITDELRPGASEIIEKYGLLMAGDSAKSAPKDTSTLANSNLSESHMESQLSFVLKDGVDYGIFVELGTSKMAARPHVIPSIEKWSQRFLDDLGRLLEP